MIRYSKSCYGLLLLFHLFGSSLPRALPFALLSAMLTWYLQVKHGEELSTAWKHPFPYQAIAFIVGFMVTFRCNLGYTRYWEGCSNMTLMTQRFADSVVQVVTFDVGNLPDNATVQQLEAAAAFRDTYLHLTSLLHAVALQELSCDRDISNFATHSSLQGDPDQPPTKREERENLGMSSWADVFMLRGGTSRGHPNRARARSRFLLPVLGGLCHEEAVALGALDDYSDLFVDQREIQGFLLENGMFAPGPTSRVHTVMAWLQQAIMERRRRGGLQAPAPLLTRMYQLLSDGMLGYEQCRKLVRIPFPFPHAQIIMFTLVLFAVTQPFMIVSFITSPTLATLIALLTQLVYWGSNEVARELEDPFLIWSSTYNCLPFPSVQWNFNEDIITFAYSVKPPEAARPDGLFPDVTHRIPVRQYGKHTMPGIGEEEDDEDYSQVGTSNAGSRETNRHPSSASRRRGTSAAAGATSVDSLPGLATVAKLSSMLPRLRSMKERAKANDDKETMEKAEAAEAKTVEAAVTAASEPNADEPVASEKAAEAMEQTMEAALHAASAASGAHTSAAASLVDSLLSAPGADSVFAGATPNGDGSLPSAPERAGSAASAVDSEPPLHPGMQGMESLAQHIDVRNLSLRPDGPPLPLPAGMEQTPSTTLRANLERASQADDAQEAQRSASIRSRHASSASCGRSLAAAEDSCTEPLLPDGDRS